MSKRMRDIAKEYLLRVEAYREEELVVALTAAYQDGYERGKSEQPAPAAPKEHAESCRCSMCTRIAPKEEGDHNG